MQPRLQSALAISALVILALWTPPSGWVVCPFRFLTGLPCPLCGLTRALSALMHGQFRQALELHALSPVVLAGIAAVAVQGLLGFRVRVPEGVPRQVFRAAAVVFFTYGILRWMTGTI